MALPPMPLRTASKLTSLYALGYPIGALAVSAMSPMAVLVLRFGLAGAILSGWALITGAVVISMNPVVTALLAAMLLGEGLTWTRVGALVLGVVAVLAACAGRLFAIGGVDTVVLLLLAALVSLAAGGVYQQRFCSGVDFRATAALQNAVAVLPVAALATIMPFEVTDPWKAAGAVAAVVLFNATLCMTLYVRAINNHGAAAVAMLFAVIPAVAGLLSWLMLGQRPDIGMA